MEIIQAKRIDLNVITQVGSGRYKRPMPIKEIGLQMEYSKDMYSIGEPISGKVLWDEREGRELISLKAQISGYFHAWWRPSSEVYKMASEGFSLCAQIDLPLPKTPKEEETQKDPRVWNPTKDVSKPSMTTTLVHEIPFCFDGSHTNEPLPPTWFVTWGKHKDCRLNYQVLVTAIVKERGEQKELQISREFRLWNPTTNYLPEALLKEPPPKFREEKSHFGGNITLAAELLEPCCKLGEKVSVKIKVVNDSKQKIRGIKWTLFNLKFIRENETASFEDQIREEQKVLKEKIPDTEIGVGQEIEKVFQLQMPSNSHLWPTIAMVHFQYKYEIEIRLDIPMARDLSGLLPIVLLP